MPPIRLHFVITNNLANAVTAGFIQGIIPSLNTFYAPGGISFDYDPAQDYEVIPDALLDRDWQLVEPRSLLNPEFDPPSVSDTQYADARREIGRRHYGKLVVICSRGSQLWPSGGGWVISDRGYNYSSGGLQYVVFLHSAIDAQTLAHEIGHYFHVMHPFGWSPATAAEAAQIMKNAVTNGSVTRAAAANVFDADLPWITDTPPDPGPNLLATVNNGDPCGPNGTVPVAVDYGTPAVPDIQTYLLTPDRTNLESYFKGCVMANQFSAQQYARMRTSIQNGNRQHLLTGQQTWAPARPAAVWLGGSLHFLAIGGDCTAYHAEMREESDLRNFPWEPLGVNVGAGTDGYVSGVGVAAMSPTQLHVVARRVSDGMLLHKILNAGSGWSPSAYGWTSLGFVAASDPVPVGGYPLNNLLHVVALGTDGALWRAEWTNGVWGAWTRVGTPAGRILSGTPSCLPWTAFLWQWWLGSGYDVAVRGDDKAVWYVTIPWIGTPGAWTSLGGEVQGSPTAWAPSTATRNVFVRGTDSALYYNRRSGSAWSGWQFLGGSIANDVPSATIQGALVHVVARAVDGRVLYKSGFSTWSPSGGGWQSLGGVTLGSPVIISNGGRLDVFARGIEGEIMHKRWDSALSTWLPSVEGWFTDGQLIHY